MLLSRCKSNNFFSYIEKKETNNVIDTMDKLKKVSIDWFSWHSNI